MDKRRVAITGLGCVTALGESPDELFDALIHGKSGVGPIDLFDASEFTVRFGGEVKSFKIENYIPQRDGKRMDRFTQFAVASAVQAVKDSGIDFPNEDSTRMGAIIGTGIGGIKEIEEQHIRLLEKGPGKVSPFCVPKLMGNAAGGSIAIMYGLQGPNICIVSACASGSHAIGEAYYSIITGRSDIMITGGSEAAVTPVGLASFCALKSLSTKNDTPQIASRPFDRDRDGFVLAEGAGVLILEELQHAKKRNAKIYAELLGYAATDDAHHITAPIPDGKGAARTMQLALQNAGISEENIDYINAHGTSTELNDIAEASAISTVFKQYAYKLAVSSTKSCLGHQLGASGAVELIAAAKAIEQQTIPPTINLDNVDERCDSKMDFVPKYARQAKLNTVMSNSFGFGGHNACLIIGKL
ncbi:MAG: beta-ketoacyl-ACP synthase II [Planctomycetota bacterium]